MKRFLMTVCAAVFSLGMFAQDYYYSEGPEKGDWAVGFGFNLGFGADLTNFGIQIPRLQYYFHPNVRAEVAFNYFFKSDHFTDLDVDVDIHPYVVPIKYGLHAYPIVGFAFWHRHLGYTDEWGYKYSDNVGRFGGNVGAGLQYDITDNIYCNLQYKYFITNDFGHSALNLGISYRF